MTARLIEATILTALIVGGVAALVIGMLLDLVQSRGTSDFQRQQRLAVEADRDEWKARAEIAEAVLARYRTGVPIMDQILLEGHAA